MWASYWSLHCALFFGHIGRTIKDHSIPSGGDAGESGLFYLHKSVTLAQYAIICRNRRSAQRRKVDAF